MSVLYSRVRIAGHPLHPMLIAFPVTFYTATLLSFAAYAATGDLFWWRMGLWSNVTAVLSAVVAAVPGFIDWSRGIPKRTRAHAVGRTHMLLNLAALAAFTINLIVQTNRWFELVRVARATMIVTPPSPVLAIVLSSIGLLFTIAAGYLGFSLVQTHHVGVDLSEEQQRLEPTGPRTP
jgi:uncharacterized membrane protein